MLCKQGKEVVIILVIIKYFSSLDPPADHVMDKPGSIDSGMPWHTTRLTVAKKVVNTLRFCAYGYFKILHNPEIPSYVPMTAANNSSRRAALTAPDIGHQYNSRSGCLLYLSLIVYSRFAVLAMPIF